MNKIRRVMAALLAAALALLMSGCAADSSPAPDSTAKQEESGMSPSTSGETAAVYHSLTQEEAKARMDSKDAPIILDVRTQAEYDAGHIAGAVLLPNESIGAEMPPELPDKDAEILVYCRSGNRSAQATRKLAQLGYTAAYDFGGINSWPYGLVTE